MRSYPGRILSLLLFAVVLTTVTGLSVVAGEGSASASSGIQAPDRQTKVYYFHRKFRCPSCVIVEATVKETLAKYFAEEMEDNRLAFETVDLDEKGNKGYVDRFELLFNSVVIVDMEKGKDIRFKNLEEIWKIYEDRDATTQYVRTEVENYLKGN